MCRMLNGVCSMSDIALCCSYISSISSISGYIPSAIQYTPSPSLQSLQNIQIQISNVKYPLDPTALHKSNPCGSFGSITATSDGSVTPPPVIESSPFSVSVGSGTLAEPKEIESKLSLVLLLGLD